MEENEIDKSSKGVETTESKDEKTFRKKNDLQKHLLSLQIWDKKLSKKILTFKPADALAVAGIHATIFSIILGFITAYALYVYGKVNEMEAQVLQEASKVNTIQLNGLNVAALGAEDFDTSNSVNRKNNLERLKMLGMGASSYRSYSRSEEGHRTSTFLPSTGAERGRLTLTALFALYTHYPFAAQSSSLYLGIDSNKVIEFKNIEYLQNWTNDMETTLPPLLWTLTNHAQIHQENFDALAADNSNRTTYKTGTNPFSVKDYLQVALTAKDILRSVKSQLVQIEARKPNKNALIVGLVIALAGFACGVVIPIIYKNPNPFIFLWLPLAIYLCVFSYLLYFIVKK